MSVRFFQVGGCVRDALLGITAKDIDYAVEAPSFDAMRDAILARGGKVFLETPQFFTIRANVPGLGACDYVLCRKDGQYKDGRHPESVAIGDIYDDLARRDFTVNAMAREMFDNGPGTLIDPHGGVTDLNDKILRCVGSAEQRFTEDGLRMLRALRFEITKGLEPDRNIDNCLCDSSFFRSRMEGVKIERVREELHRCFAFNTHLTLQMLNYYRPILDYVFGGGISGTLWLKPTLEVRG